MNGTVVNGQHVSHDEITGRVTPGNEMFSLAQDGPRPYLKCDPGCEFCEKENQIKIVGDEFKCDKCGEPITGAYASMGGNIVPYIPAKRYHIPCVPTVSELLQQSTPYNPTDERFQD